MKKKEEMTNREIVADYLVRKLQPEEINGIASLLKDESAKVFGDVIITNDDGYDTVQVISIAKSGSTGGNFMNQPSRYIKE